MRSNEKLVGLAYDLLQKLYEAADPPLDFNKFRAKVDRTGKCPKDWFLKHRLAEADYERIVAAFRKKQKVTDQEWRRMSMIMLDFAPTHTEAR